jgi:outer membrane protein OmpA-like peptidoglycan-associated protein
LIVTLLLLFGVGFMAVVLLAGDGESVQVADEAGLSPGLTDPGSTTGDDAIDDATATTAVAAATDEGTDAEEPALELPSAEDLPTGEDADRMSIQIETQSSENSAGEGGATATVREDGRLYFEGAFRSQDEADRFITRAAEVFGAEAIVESYSIDPAAPRPAAADVALDKPVLFESGSAEIHPDYIPFLEACGNVLKLNPQITMSIYAFTDSTGSQDFNLRLSQERAQAIVDFYQSMDVDDRQLVGTGFGEDAQFGDNLSEEGRSENRRAMLQLLNVMSDA